MTDKEKLIKIEKLADAMYYAAQYLTTDASRLHKAMDEYHKFIIHECKEEPISKVWHSKEETPTESKQVLVAYEGIGGIRIVKWQKEFLTIAIDKWAYIEDILNL